MTWLLRRCPHCGGDMYLAVVTRFGVRIGEQWECLQCSRVEGSLKKHRVGGGRLRIRLTKGVRGTPEFYK